MGSNQEFKISGVNFEKFGSQKNNINMKKMPSERLAITKTRMKSMDNKKLSDYRLKSSRNLQMNSGRKNQFSSTMRFSSKDNNNPL